MSLHLFLLLESMNFWNYYFEKEEKVFKSTIKNRLSILQAAFIEFCRKVNYPTNYIWKINNCRQSCILLKKM